MFLILYLCPLLTRYYPIVILLTDIILFSAQALNFALSPFHKITAVSDLQAQLLLNLVLSE